MASRFMVAVLVLMPIQFVDLEVKIQGSSFCIANLLKESGLTSGTSEAIRLINQGAVKIDGEKVSDAKLEISINTQKYLSSGQKEICKSKIE